jgi:hypothetical protein
MCATSDSQDLGLEADILERVRKISMVKLACEENVTGLKHSTEAWDSIGQTIDW